jgi:ABC-2 type transport system ATP-binding protein
VIADDTAEALKAKLAGDRLAITAQDAPAARRIAQLAGNLPDARDVTLDGLEVGARVGNGPAALPELLRAAARDGIDVATAQVHRPTLDDVFLNLTGRSLREESGTASDPGRNPA